MKHLKNLIDEMVKEEMRMKDKIMKKMRVLTDELANLSRELSTPAFQARSHDASNLQTCCFCLLKLGEQ